MKNAQMLAILLACAFLTCSVCLAADTPTSKEFVVSAAVGTELELTGWVKEMSAGQTDPGTQGTLRSFPYPFNFGTLTSELSGGGGAGCLYSEKWYAVFLVAKTSGRAYRIQSSGISLGGSGNAAGYSLPDKSFVLKPDYKTADKWEWSGGSAVQGADPNSGSSLGSAGSAVGTHDIYNSGTGGASRIIRAYYSIPGYPATGDPIPYTGWSPVPLDQHYGPYGGMVTVSLVLTGA